MIESIIKISFVGVFSIWFIFFLWSKKRINQKKENRIKDENHPISNILFLKGNI